MKKRLSGIIVALLIGISMGGCSLLGSPIAEKVADVVDDYCKEPLAARQLYRETVNGELAIKGHSIEVTCAGDPNTTSRLDEPGRDAIATASIQRCAISSCREVLEGDDGSG